MGRRRGSWRAVVAAAGATVLLPVVVAGPAGADGTVVATGDDFAGQLGDGLPFEQQLSPVVVSGLESSAGVTAVSAGFTNSAALHTDGRVQSWGENGAGEVGDGGVGLDRWAPATIMGPGSGVVELSANNGYALGLRSNGSVISWGFSTTTPQVTPRDEGGLGAGSGVVAISAGSGHRLALRADGQVLAWGLDRSGQLGDGGAIPGPDRAAPAPVAIPAGSRVVEVAAGGEHSLALRSDGTVLAWGKDIYGQLGDGGAVPGLDRSAPVVVSGLGPGSGVVAVSAGHDHSLALRSDGTVLAWGFNFAGLLGDGGPFPGANRSTPGPVLGLGAGSGIVEIVAGRTHSLARRADGSILGWGYGGAGELGNSRDAFSQSVPVAMNGLGPDSRATAMSAGGTHSLVVVGGARPGYTLVTADGGIHPFGRDQFWGSTSGEPLHRPVVAMRRTASGHGYWLVASDGGVFAYGDAGFFGSAGGVALSRPIVGMAPTPSGRGYWLVAADGGVFAYGDAGFFGSTGGTALHRPVVGIERTATGRGYWLVAADGGVFAFGDAAFLGSTGGTALKRPVVGMARSTTGAGYHLVAADGGVFAFGGAPFAGSAGGLALNAPIVGMAPEPGGGYRLCAGDGGVFGFGVGPFWGSLAGTRLPSPVVGCATALL